jgi:hypothetical protein
MDIGDGHALRNVAVDAGARDLAGLVGGIIEDLDVQELARIVEAGDGFDEALYNVALIENGKLHGHARPILHFVRRAGHVF